MAEAGTTATLVGEVNDAMPNADRHITIPAPDIGSSSTQTGVVFTSDHPRLTLTSMIAPTPDWFVGVSGLSLLDSSGNWRDSVTVDLYPWDAGTEDGTGFSLTNAETDPQGVIASIRGRAQFTGARIARLVVTRTGTVQQAPAAPAGFAPAAADGAVTLGWTVPAAAGITGHEYRQKAGGAYGAWTAIPDSAPAEANEDSFTVTGLDNGTLYTFQLRAVNAVGGGVSSAEVAATPNAPASGTVTITGTAEVGQTLTVSVSGVTDRDGVPSGVTYTYQWVQVDGPDETDIAGATASTYALVAADQGKKVKVKVSFEDDVGNDEELSSAAYPSSRTVGATSTDATLSALSLGTGVTLSPEFAGATTDYRAWVANPVASVTVTATKNDDGATVAITGDDDTATPGTATLSLDPGRNTVEVTVTAEDGNTPGTYTVTVAREAAAPTPLPAAILTAALTVGERDGFPGYNALLSPTIGAITGADFEVDSTRYELGLLVQFGATAPTDFNPETVVACFAASANPPDAVRNALVLLISGKTFRFDASTAITTDDCYAWPRPAGGLGWSYGEIVAVAVALDVTSPMLSSVEVTSTPERMGDTYGVGEKIRFTVTFDDPVRVTGTPHFEFSLGPSGSEVDKEAALESGDGTTALVFAYTVLAADMDDNGITVRDHTRTIKLDTGETIRDPLSNTADAELSHIGLGTLGGHKVDGSLSPLPPPPPPTEVPANWGLVPSGLSEGDAFRLLIVTSTRQNAEDTAIADYNRVVQGDVSSTGHAVIRSYSAGFNALGCTRATSAIVNTYTGSTDTAAAIYWLNGAKVADDYADLYDDSWDSHAPRYPGGTNAPTSGAGSRAFTGCRDSGASSGSNYLGAGQVREGNPVSPGFEIEASSTASRTDSRRFYGLSGIFRVGAAAPTVSSVAVTSTPHAASNTYGAGELIRFTVTFTEEVEVSASRPHFEFALGSAGSGVDTEAAYERGSGTTALVFVYTVLAADRDNNGIWIGDQTRTIKLDDGEYIRAVDNQVSALLNHAARRTQSGHQVDGSLTPTGHSNAIGAPAISGTAQIGETLTAAIGNIDDADGLPSSFPADYSFQWIREDSGGSNAVHIFGATSSTYVLLAADEGKKVKVRVSFQDIDGNDEELTSAAYPASGIVGEIYSATLGVGIPSPGFVGYSSGSAGSLNPDSFTDDGTGYTITYLGVSLSGELILDFNKAPPSGWTLHVDGVAFPFDDASRFRGNRELNWANSGLTWSNGDTVNVRLTTLPAMFTNTPAAGAPSISGTAQAGETLTAARGSIDDDDGLPSTFPNDYTFQWIREDSDATNPVNIGTDSSTYALVAADEGKKIKVRVSFRDDDGNAEARTSAPYPSGMETVAAAVIPPVQAQTEVPASWSLIPSGLGAGADFRLLIVTSTQQTAENTDIADYNTVVQGDVSGNGHTDIQGYSAGFNMLGCTETTSASANTNTASTDTAAPIYWLNGAKVADDYADLYDGSWDSNAPKYPAGTDALTSGLPSVAFTGCGDTGVVRALGYLGSTDADVNVGYPGNAGFEFSNVSFPRTDSHRFYGLSEIFRVAGASTSTDATLSALSLGTGVTLSPEFAGATTDYRAWVANPVASVTVTATKNDDGATVAITGDDDTATPGTATLSLDPGRNTVEVTVTAEDGNTPGTYTVTVVREAAAPTADPAALLTANLTVGERDGFPGYNALVIPPFGAMTDDDFEVDVTTYELAVLGVFGATGPSIFNAETVAACFVDTAKPSEAVRNTLLLRIGSESFRFDASTPLNAASRDCYEWARPAGLSWSYGDIALVKVANVRNATGAPAISGTARVGETLTAAKGSIADVDGLPATFPDDYTFQWIRVDADGESNREEISGATSSTYALVAADEGKKIRVRVSFQDDDGNAEALTSAQYPSGTETVAAMTFTPMPPSALVSNFGQGSDDLYGVQSNTDLSIPFTTGPSAAGGYILTGVEIKSEDTGGDSYSVSVCPTGDDGFPATPCTALTPPASFAAGTHTFTAPFLEAAAETTYAVVIIGGSGRTDFDSTNSNDEDSGSAAGWRIADSMAFRAVTPDWNPGTSEEVLRVQISGVEARPASTSNATGAPTISGTGNVGATLSASTGGIADADGLADATYRYQWLRVDGADETDIEGATSSTYTLTAADADKKVKVRVTFLDDANNIETLTSAAYPSSDTVKTPPTIVSVAVTSTPTADTDTYGVGEAIEFTVTFSEAVEVSTGRPHFEFELGPSGNTVTKEATYQGGSDTTALVFAYTVLAADMDDNGVWIGDQSATLKLDTGEFIRAVDDQVAAVLDHAGHGTQSDHKVDGSVTPPGSTDATLSALSLGTGVTLSPEFAGATTDYRAWVANPVASVTVTATKNDDGATVAITGDDDTATPGTATLSLDPGRNTVEVTVTAEDGNTPGTYTVTVVREAAAPTADPAALLTANLTVGERDGFPGYNALAIPPFGAMTDDDFEVDVTTYELGVLGVFGATGPSIFNAETVAACFVDTAKPPEAVRNTLLLRIGGESFRFDASTALNAASRDCYEWARPTGLSWSYGDIALVKVANVPNATGTPEISGTAALDSMLTASPGTIRDEDGLIGASYSYQWIRVDEDGSSNAVDIEGATSSTYTLTLDDEGKKIKVKASFTDDGRTPEARTSDAYPAKGTVRGPAIAIAPSQAKATGRFDLIIYALERTGPTTAAAAVTVTLAPPAGNDWGIPDSNLSHDVSFGAGEASKQLFISLRSSGGASVGFSATATTSGTLVASLSNVTGYDTTDTAEVEVVVTGNPSWIVRLTQPSYSFHEDGGAQTVTVEAYAASAAIPAPSLDLAAAFATVDGTAGSPLDFAAVTEVVSVLTPAFSADSDGIQRGQATITFTPAQDSTEEGSETLSFRLSRAAGIPSGVVQYEAAGGTRSDSTADYPVTIIDDDDVTMPMLSTATVDGASLALTYNELLDEGSKPPPGAFTVSVDSGSGTAPSRVDVGGRTVTLTLADAVTDRQTVTVSYTVPTEAGTNPIRDGAQYPAAALAGETVTNNTPDKTEPALESATVNGASLVLTYDEALDEGSKPPRDAFTVSVAGAARALAADDPVDVSGKTVTLTLVTAAEHGETVTLTYMVPTGTDPKPIRDRAQNNAAALTNQEVTTNNAATGAPTISGTARVGETLTAATTGILDEDGLNSATYGYQWIREDSDGMNPMDIGTDSSTYELVAADEGKKIKVQVSFTDDDGNDEELTSAASDTIAAAPPMLGPVLISNTGQSSNSFNSPNVELNSGAQQFTTGANPSGYDLDSVDIQFEEFGGVVVTASLYTSDDNDLPGTSVFNFTNPATITANSVSNFAAPDGTTLDASTDYFIVVSATPEPGFIGTLQARAAVTASNSEDASPSPGWSINNEGHRLSGSTWSSHVTSFKVAVRGAAVASTNTPATGVPAITGTAQVNKTLTADMNDIADTDGLPATFPDDYTFQWIRVDADGESNREEISGATARTYTLVAVDAGKRFRVRVGFTDGEGHAEARTSDATVPPPDCTAGHIWCATLTVARNPTGNDKPHGYCDPAAGSSRCTPGYGGLSDTDFDLDGTTYTVESLRWGTDLVDGSGTLHLTLDRDFPAASLGRVTLRVGSHFFAPGSATRGNSDGENGVANNYRWRPAPAAIRGLPVGAFVTVELLPNAPPVFDTGLPATLSVAENSAPDTNIGNPFTATDPDTGDTLTYTLEGDDGDNFGITSTGRIQTRAHLDHEAKTSHSVTVKVSDGGASATHAVTIGVTDESDTGDASLTPPDDDPEVARKSRATYSIRIEGDWDTGVTPGGVPPGAHFTTFVGGIHNDQVAFLEAGETASAGVEAMAEEGTTATLAGEVNAGKPDALAALTYGAPGIAGNRTETGVVFTSDHPRLTLTSMIAPTPDWFVGVSGLSLLDSSGDWLSSRTVDCIRGTRERRTVRQRSPARGRGRFTGERIAGCVHRPGRWQAPAAPDGSTTAGDGGVTLGWTVPAATGITSHEYRQKAGDVYGAWTAIPDSAPSEANEDSFTVTGLSNGTLYTFQLRAVNAVGGGVSSAEVAATPNAPASGTVTITGTAEVGQTLTVSVSGVTDRDGVPSGVTYTYQWVRVDGTDETDIAGATSSTYALVAADQGKKVMARVAFTDDEGNAETLTSGAYPSGADTVAADDTEPMLSTATVNGASLELTYNELLDGDSKPPPGAFMVSVDSGDGTAPSMVDVSGKTVTLTLASAVTDRQTVTVSYTVPTEAGTNPIRDGAQHPAAALAGETVTNNTPDKTEPALESATVNGASLVLTYDEDLDESSVPPRDAFTVSVAGAARALAAADPVDVSGKTVTLTLAAAVTDRQTVTLTYRVPTGTDPMPIRDTAEINAAALAGQKVTNESDDTTGPEYVSASVAEAGTSLTIVFDETLDAVEANLPAAARFTVSATDRARFTVGSVAVSGVAVTLTLRAAPPSSGRTRR